MLMAFDLDEPNSERKKSARKSTTSQQSTRARRQSLRRAGEPESPVEGLHYPMMPFELLKIRHSMGLRQDEFGALVGCCTGSMVAYERGTRIIPVKVQVASMRLAKAQAYTLRGEDPPAELIEPPKPARKRFLAWLFPDARG